MLLARNLPGAPSAEAPSSRLGRKAEEFRRLLGRHFREERSLGFYAERLGVSETHLNRICRAALGRSALGLIHERILAEAQRDLAFTTMGVAEIAHSLGFEDPAYFSRFFARRAGASPRAYRRDAVQRMAGPT